MPLVSVVVPVYNLESYVERCLQSLVAQTLNDLEVLVVDDGSTDQSPAIIRRFAERYPGKIRAFTKPNGGHGSACNFGIEHALGTWVKIVDGDDFLEPDTCAFLAARAEETGADLVIGNLRHIFEDRTQPFKPLPIDGEKLLDAADRTALFQSWATPCGRLYRRTLFSEDPALRFLPGIIFADVNFVPKSYLAAQRIYYVDRIVYEYDVTRPAQSVKQTDRRVLNVIPALRDMLAYYRQKGAFEAYREPLMGYAVRHCFAWIGKVETLQDYPRQKALRELFAVLDEHFGTAWRDSPQLREVAGRRRALLIRTARQLGYAPLVWSWQLREVNARVDARAEQVLGPGRALDGYRALRRRLDRELFDRLSI